MRYLGIDLGSKTVGLAISDTTLTIASSLKTIFFKDEDYLSTIDEIKNIIKEYDIQKIILGLPKNMNNTLGERAEITTKYKREGKEIEFEILFTFESDETKKNYMVYTDNTKDEEGNTKVYASVFKPDAEPLELLPVETEREWKIIETIITSITEESKKEKKEDK